MFNFFIKLTIFIYLFWDWDSLCNPCWPWFCNLPVSASQSAGSWRPGCSKVPWWDCLEHLQMHKSLPELHGPFCSKLRYWACPGKVASSFFILSFCADFKPKQTFWSTDKSCSRALNKQLPRGLHSVWAVKILREAPAKNTYRALVQIIIIRNG